MKIGVISDTHVKTLDELPRKLVDELSGVDLIVHAGDFTGKRLLDGLRNLGEFKGVYGNMDPPEIRSELPAVVLFEVAGFKIGVTHPAEGGAPFRLKQRIRKKFGQVDVVIYGHSHWAKNETREDILYFNPGSATGKLPAKYKSYGILKIENDIDAQMVKF